MRTDIQQARKAKGLTQQQLAEAIGRDQATVARYEAGKTDIGKDIALPIASALGMSVLDVLYPKQAKPTRQKREAA